ncbi:YbfB/YjiJ family MFS transporter, partial [Escherichia coli]|uniref:YbfB/YjiJ family MFS transporter n=1 Tax=Escherichia coli TaxID=562 RepID=UPI001915634E
YYWVLYGIGAVVGPLLTGHLADRAGFAAALRAAFLIEAVAVALPAVTTSPAALIVSSLIVGGFTLPLVAKFAQGHDRAHGWQVTMTIWAVLCLVLFLVTFFTTKERIRPLVEETSSPWQD